MAVTSNLAMRLPIHPRTIVVVASLLLATSAPHYVGAQQPASPRSPTPLVLQPPDSGKIQRLTLKDGSQLVGRIVSVDSTSVRFESSLGVSTLAIDAIESVKQEQRGQLRGGRYYFPNPNATRLVFAPTGRMLQQGEGYFSDYWIFFPGIAVGVTDRFTMGGGMSLVPEVGLDQQILYITPKLGLIQSPKLNVAVGALAASIPFDSESETAGILYGVSTWGEVDASFTAGLGYGFVNGDLADSPIIMAGGELRASPRISLVTENYLFPGGGTGLSGGIRFLARDISVDLAIATFHERNDSFWLPFLGFVWKW